LVDLEKGIYTRPGRLTVADLLDRWLEGYVKTQCSSRTLDSHGSIIEHHLKPRLGHIPLKALHSEQIDHYYAEAVEKLSKRSVHYHHRILSQALTWAVRKGYLGRNPDARGLTDPPSPDKKLMRTLTPSEVGVLLDTAKDSYYYPVIYTAVSSGLRQAELLGLHWRDVDADIMMSISVSQVLYKRRGVCEFKEPKTAHSRRSVKMTPKLASFLREYKLERERLYRELGKEFALDDLVFASVEGKPIDPGVLSHAFAKIVKRAGLEHVRFHDLRHTFASLMLARRAPPKVISEALGHSSVAFTMDTYSHIIEGMQEEAMALLDEVLPAGVSKQNNADLTRLLGDLASKGR
jgi:integrase